MARLPKEMREAFYEKLELFMENPYHPSLRVKQIKGTDAIWEMSITMKYRATFMIHPHEVFFRKIGPHDVLKSP